MFCFKRCVVCLCLGFGMLGQVFDVKVGFYAECLGKTRKGVSTGICVLCFLFCFVFLVLGDTNASVKGCIYMLCVLCVCEMVFGKY